MKRLTLALVVGFLAACTTDPLTECQSTCAGCCGSDGVCASGDSTTACGPAGSICNVCSGGQICTAKACVLPVCTPLTGYYFFLFPSNPRFVGNTANCSGAPADLVPASMSIDFLATIAEFRANGATLLCDYTRNNCSVTANCMSGYAELTNVVITPDMATLTGDVLFRRANDECNLTFRVAGSR